MKDKTNFLTSIWGVVICSTICCALWGSAFPGIKVGYLLFDISAEAINSQILFAGVRFIIAGAVTILIASLINKKFVVPKKTSWNMIGILCAFQTVIQYLFFYIGLAYASGVKSSIIHGSYVFWAILIACFVFKQENMTNKKLLGCLLGFIGVVLVNWSPGGMDLGMKWYGEGFILLAAICYAIASVLTKDFSMKENAMVLSGYQFIMGGFIMAAVGLLLGGRLLLTSLPALAMLVYLGAVSAVAYALWAILLKYNLVSRVAVYGFMNPVFGVLFSAMFLKEGGQEFGIKVLVALLLVCIGIFVVNREKTGTV